MISAFVTSPDKLWICRHGESEHNVARAKADAILADILDCDMANNRVALTTLGVEQASDLGAYFGALSESDRPDIVLVSPYLRARQTAETALRHAGIDQASIVYLVDERLREKNFGILDNLTRAGIRARFPAEDERYRIDGKFYYQAPGGESWADVVLRLRSLREEVRSRFAGRRVAIFSHQVVLQCWRYIEENLSVEEILEIDRKADVPNCGVVEYSSSSSSAVDLAFGKMQVDKLYFVAPKCILEYPKQLR